MLNKLTCFLWASVILYYSSFFLNKEYPCFFTKSPGTSVPADILSDPETQYYHKIRKGSDWSPDNLRGSGANYIGRIVVNLKRNYLEFQPVTLPWGESKSRHFKSWILEEHNNIRMLKGKALKHCGNPITLFLTSSEPGHIPPLSPGSKIVSSLRADIPTVLGEKYFKNGWSKSRVPEGLGEPSASPATRRP